MFLSTIGFRNLKSDPAIYYALIDTIKVYLVIYVDDMLIISKSTNVIQNVKSTLSKKYRMKDFGIVREFLGINICYDSNNCLMTLNQSKMIIRMLSRFAMKHCKCVSTPMDRNFTTSLQQSDDYAPDVVPYLETVGCLLYLSMCTKPDFTYAATILSKFCEQPKTLHWILVKRVFRYLQQTSHYGLVYTTSNNHNLIAYSDAD